MKVNQFNISWPVGELGEECKPEKTICLLVMVDNQINDPGPLHIYLKYLYFKKIKLKKKKKNLYTDRGVSHALNTNLISYPRGSIGTSHDA
jgi:hypothetical protein